MFRDNFRIVVYNFPFQMTWLSLQMDSENFMSHHRPDGDVQLLVLSRIESNELFENYPEQVFLADIWVSKD